MARSRLQQLAQEVGAQLKAKNATVSLAETTTGGLIGSALIAIPGASSFFVGGVNAYSLKARDVFLGGNGIDYEKYDGPTEEIVLRLAKSIQGSLGTTYAVAESGAAGPTLAAKYRSEIEVGYNPLVAVGPNGTQKSKIIKTGLSGREENMQAFAEECLQLLLELMSSSNQANL